MYSPEPMQHLSSYLEYELTSHREDRPVSFMQSSSRNQFKIKPVSKWPIKPCSGKEDNVKRVYPDRKNVSTFKNGPVKSEETSANVFSLPLISRPRRRTVNKKGSTTNRELVRPQEDPKTRVEPVVCRYSSSKVRSENNNTSQASTDIMLKTPRRRQCACPSTAGRERKGKLRPSSGCSIAEENLESEHRASSELYLPSSSSLATPEGYLQSYRQFRAGRKKYEVFWSPAANSLVNNARRPLFVHGTAKSLEAVCSSSENLTRFQNHVATSANEENIYGDTHNETGAEIKGELDSPKSHMMSSHFPATSVSETDMGDQKLSDQHEHIPVSRDQAIGRGNGIILPVAIDDEDHLMSDFNDEELGELDIVSSCSDRSTPEAERPVYENEAISSPPPGDEIPNENREASEQTDNDLRVAVAGFVADVITKAQEIHVGRMSRQSQN